MQRRWSRRHMTHFFNITKTTKWLVSAPDERVAALIKAARPAPLPYSPPLPRARDDMVFMVEAVPGRQTEAYPPPPDGLRRPAEAARSAVRPPKPRQPPPDGLK